MNNAFRDKSKDHKSKHYWFRYLLGQGLNNHNLISLSPYPREISQATMMAGSTRWQSAVIGGNGAWRARMRTMNPKSNRTCLYRRSDRGPVLCSTGPLSDLRYRQVRLDLGFIVRMRDRQAPLPPITADCHRLLPAIIVAWEISRGYTRRQRYQIMVVQALTEQIPEPSVLICDLWICQEMRYSLYVRRNARFFHLYENLKLQDRLISLTLYYLDKMAIIQDTRSYSLR